MSYSEPIKAKYNKETKTVNVSISLGDDVVVTRKVTSDQFKRIVAHMNSVLYEVEQDTE